MKTVIKVLSICLVFLPALVFSSAYQDTYESDIQNELYTLEQESKYDKDTQFDIKRKAYLKNRLKHLKNNGITSIVFTSKLKYNEPVDSLASVKYTQGKIYLFIRIQGMQGQYLTHTWLHNNVITFEKRMKVRGKIWKMWTWIKLKKKDIGNWEVLIYDEDDKILTRKRFLVTP